MSRPVGSVITAALSAVVATPRSRVWRALTDPAELIRWDETMLELLEPAEGYPRVGQRLRWRSQLGGVTVVMHDRPLEVVPGQRLRSDVALGLFHFDRTWSLAGEPGGPERTRLGLSLAAASRIPVLGGSVDRFDVRRLATEYVDTRLRALQRWCESGGSGDAP